MAQGYKRIARVVKTHGIKGEVVAVPAGGLPPVLSQGLEVCVVPPLLRADRWHNVEDVETSEAGQLIALSGVDDTTAAHELVGKYLLAKLDALESLEEMETFDDYLGLDVIDERLGLLGSISEIMVGTVQDVLVVQGDKGETLIPDVDEFVLGFNDDESALLVQIPFGLAPWDEGE